MTATHERLRHQLLGWWARFVCHHPWWVIVVALVFAGAGVGVTQRLLTFQSNRNDLISPKLSWNKRYIEYSKMFAGQDRIAAVVAVPPGPDGKQRAEKFVDQLAEKIAAEHRHIHRAWYGFDASPIMLRIAPLKQFNTELDKLKQAGPILKAQNVGEMLTSMVGLMAQAEKAPPKGAAPPTPPTPPTPAAEQAQVESGVQDIHQLHAILAGIHESLAGAPPADAFNEKAMGLSTWQYLTSSDGQLYFIDIEPKAAPGELDPYGPAIQHIRRSLDEMKKLMPGVEAGVTGLPVLDSDETAISTHDAELSSIYSAIGIAVLLLIAYHGWQLPLMAVLSLGVGICWAFGFVTLGIGHIQILSVVFTTILLGLGMDYGVHLMSRFELIRHNYPDDHEGFCATLADSMQTVGPGMITGAVTTAIAFGTTLLTNFLGMAEMGLIAGVGVVLCLIAMWSVLPAAMRIFRPCQRHVVPPQNRLINLHSLRYLGPLVRHPGVTVAFVVVVVGVASVGMVHVQFDNNLQDMMPRGLAALKWQDRIAQHSDQAIWSASSIVPDLATARRLTHEFQAIPAVASVGGIGLIAPADEDQKLAEIRKVRGDLAPVLESTNTATPPPTAASLRQRLFGLQIAMAVAMSRSDVQKVPEIRTALAQVSQEVQQTLATMSDPQFVAHAADRLAALHTAFTDLKAKMVKQIDLALQTRPLELSDLPEYLLHDSVSITKPTRYQLSIYPRENVWDPAKLAPFIKQLRRVDPQVTGSPVQIYESGLLMQRSYQFAGALALLVVLTLVYFDLRTRGLDIRGTLATGLAAVLLILGVWASLRYDWGPELGHWLVARGWTELGPWLERWGYWLPAVVMPAVGVIVALTLDAAGLIDAVLCLLPVTLGFVTTFGVMYIAGYQINPANLIILPLLFGIGVAQGVNIVHRYRQHPYTRPLGLSHGTGKAIPLTSLTTIIAFAAMLPAKHRGIQSLGFVLAVGLTLTLIACMTVMPALLELRNRSRAARRLRRIRTVSEN